MFREMRRNKQKLSKEECETILKNGTSGTLALNDYDSFPYAVPLSYVYDNGKVFFHCAKEGHKLDCINSNNKASFCVIGSDDVVPEKYTTYYRSVILFGKITIIEDDNKKYETISMLAKKYSPNESKDSVKQEIDSYWNSLCMLEFNIEHMSGKECIELVKK